MPTYSRTTDPHQAKLFKTEAGAKRACRFANANDTTYGTRWYVEEGASKDPADLAKRYRHQQAGPIWRVRVRGITQHGGKPIYLTVMKYVPQAERG